MIAIGHLGLKSGSPDFEMHTAAYVKLAEAIARSGDGFSQATAFKVLVPSEEYLICGIIGAKVQNQSLVNQDKASFDVLKVKKDEWPQPIELWFDVSLLMPR